MNKGDIVIYIEMSIHDLNLINGKDYQVKNTLQCPKCKEVYIDIGLEHRGLAMECCNTIISVGNTWWLASDQFERVEDYFKK